MARFELARALWATGGNHARAAELAADAERALTGAVAAPERARVIAWRRAHPIP